MYVRNIRDENHNGDLSGKLEGVVVAEAIVAAIEIAQKPNAEGTSTPQLTSTPRLKDSKARKKHPCEPEGAWLESRSRHEEAKCKYDASEK